MSLGWFFGEIGVSGLVDITFVALVIYGLLAWLKRTRRAALVLAGILIVTGVYLAAQQFDLLLMVAVLKGFFAVFLIALVVIFQEELRYLFERIAAWSLGRSLGAGSRTGTADPWIETMVHTLKDLARNRIGALVVLRGRDPLARHLDGGIELDGRISEALLKSLFDPHSIGHDGAVIVATGRISAFGALLPLSRGRSDPGSLGTRHAAALGLSERADALCLVVSEERGTISCARHGRLWKADPAELGAVIEEFVRETAPERRPTSTRRLVTSNLREKLVAVAIAFALWFVLVHGSGTVYRSYAVPVRLAQVPTDLTVDTVVPDEVEVTLSGQRKSFYFLRSGHLSLTLRGWDLTPGRTMLTVAPTDLAFPENLILENIKPRTVRVEASPGATASGTTAQ